MRYRQLQIETTVHGIFMTLPDTFIFFFQTLPKQVADEENFILSSFVMKLL